MFKKVLITGILSTGLLIASPLMAHGNNHHNSHNPGHHSHQQCLSGNGIDRRQANQKRRIKKGVRNGQLVKWEAKALKYQQRNIRKLEKRLRKSGHCLTKSEAKRIKRKLNRASRQIRNLRHNNIRRHHH